MYSAGMAHLQHMYRYSICVNGFLTSWRCQRLEHDIQTTACDVLSLVKHLAQN